MAKGFSVPCIKCNETETVRIDLHDLAAFHCTACDEDFGANDVRDYLESARSWEAVLAFVETAPEV